ncbi:trans-sulfuration enzyme family protein [Calditrichota bacterium]
MKNNKKWNINTQIIKSGEGKDFSNIRTPGVPIFQTSNYLYENIDNGTDILLSKAPGHIYARYSNPTVDTLNEIIADLENGEAALSFASGMAAISSTFLAYCEPGDHIVSSAYIYGGTFTFFQNQLSRFKIEVTFVDPRDHKQLEKAIQPNTKILYTEPLANPTLIASDINFWQKVAKKNQCKLIIDNTFSPPSIFRPLEWGADVVIHSATKYLGGHSDLIGGVVCGTKEEIETIRPIMKTFGPTIAPIISWLIIRGIRTLGVRVEKQNYNAYEIAKFLSNHPKVNKVFHAGLSNNPQYELNKKQFNGYTGMLAFEVKGGWPQAKKVMESLKLVLFTVSLGDVSSLISHPASTSHVYLSAAEREKIGITDGLLRLSVGLEHIDDLIYDLDQAL